MIKDIFKEELEYEKNRLETIAGQLKAHPDTGLYSVTDKNGFTGFFGVFKIILTPTNSACNISPHQLNPPET